MEPLRLAIGRNRCCSCLGAVSLLSMIILLVVSCQLVLDVRGEESQFNHELSLQGRRGLESGLPNSNASEAHILLEFRANTVDVNGSLAGWDTAQNPNVCTWMGVQCDHSGHIASLDLSGMGLSGDISSSLGSLQFLTSLDLSNNSFYGEVPSSLGNLRHLQNVDMSANNNLTHFPFQFSNWTALTSLNLSRNALTGFIPANVGNLQNLSQLDLQDNFLTSFIPASLGNCSSLSWLDLGFNQFVGRIPPDLGRLGKLKILRLRFNNLTGPIPSSVYNISSLTDLSLDNNLLSGEISPDIGLLINLLDLRLDVNNFTGSIPRSIGNLSSLETLIVGGAALLGHVSPVGGDSWLGGEWLTGPVPIELGKLQSLQVLYLYRTKCTGTIPAELGNLPKLKDITLLQNQQLTPSVIPSTFRNLTSLFKLFLLGNNFYGNIPSWIGNFVNVGHLDLRYNNFSGELPPEIGNMTMVWRLLLSGNSLRGPVIPELGKLAHLNDLALDQNWFSGPLPTNLGNLSSLVNLYLRQNNLSGIIPPAMLTGMPHLRDVGLDNNQFSGPIPREIGSLTALHDIRLSSNQLSGPIPPEIGKCLSLTIFDISHNRISGQLPLSSLENLVSLRNFTVNDNLLEGPVPPNNGTFKNVTVNYAGNEGLCGPELGKNCYSPTQPPRAKERCHGLGLGCHRARIYIVVGVGTAVVAILACICLLCWKMSGWRPSAARKTSGHRNLGDNFPDVNLFIKDFNVTVDELWASTNGFSQENILGKGGSSTVYKATLVNQNNMLIAVKLVNLNNMGTKRAVRDLHNELKMLGSLRHRNLLRLYGVCATPTFKALLMELVSGGSLWFHLHSSEEQRQQLSLASRLRIAIGVADALVYLHNDCHRQIIHRDLKPSNILLDHECNPKVADFGISKFVNRDKHGEATASNLFGSIGYIPPEYATSCMVSTKGDVYSFGVIVLEMLTGKAPTDKRFHKNETLVEWVERASPDQMVDILDDHLRCELDTHEPELQLLVHVGLLCTRSSPKARPSMEDVKQLLIEAKNPKVDKGDITHLL